MESKGMKMKRWKRILLCVATVLTIGWMTAGCNTLHGAGKDIEAGGEAVQDVAD
jgi:predicted small secreted protein